MLTNLQIYVYVIKILFIFIGNQLKFVTSYSVQNLQKNNIKSKDNINYKKRKQAIPYKEHVRRSNSNYKNNFKTTKYRINLGGKKCEGKYHNFKNIILKKYDDRKILSDFNMPKLSIEFEKLTPKATLKVAKPSHVACNRNDNFKKSKSCNTRNTLEYCQNEFPINITKNGNNNDDIKSNLVVCKEIKTDDCKCHKQNNHKVRIMKTHSYLKSRVNFKQNYKNICGLPYNRTCVFSWTKCIFDIRNIFKYILLTTVGFFMTPCLLLALLYNALCWIYLKVVKADQKLYYYNFNNIFSMAKENSNTPRILKFIRNNRYIYIPFKRYKVRTDPQEDCKCLSLYTKKDENRNNQRNCHLACSLQSTNKKKNIKYLRHQRILKLNVPKRIRKQFKNRINNKKYCIYCNIHEKHKKIETVRKVKECKPMLNCKYKHARCSCDILKNKMLFLHNKVNNCDGYTNLHKPFSKTICYIPQKSTPFCTQFQNYNPSPIYWYDKHTYWKNWKYNRPKPIYCYNRYPFWRNCNNISTLEFQNYNRSKCVYCYNKNPYWNNMNVDENRLPCLSLSVNNVANCKPGPPPKLRVRFCRFNCFRCVLGPLFYFTCIYISTCCSWCLQAFLCILFLIVWSPLIFLMCLIQDLLCCCLMNC